MPTFVIDAAIILGAFLVFAAVDYGIVKFINRKKSKLRGATPIHA